jgi:hypothetical protein
MSCGPYETVKDHLAYFNERVMPDKKTIVNILTAKRFDLCSCVEDHPKLSDNQLLQKEKILDMLDQYRF